MLSFEEFMMSRKKGRSLQDTGSRSARSSSVLLSGPRELAVLDSLKLLRRDKAISAPGTVKQPLETSSSSDPAGKAAPSRSTTGAADAPGVGPAADTGGQTWSNHQTKSNHQPTNRISGETWLKHQLFDRAAQPQSVLSQTPHTADDAAKKLHKPHNNNTASGHAMSRSHSMRPQVTPGLHPGTFRPAPANDSDSSSMLRAAAGVSSLVQPRPVFAKLSTPTTPQAPTASQLQAAPAPAPTAAQRLGTAAPSWDPQPPPPPAAAAAATLMPVKFAPVSPTSGSYLQPQRMTMRRYAAAAEQFSAGNIPEVLAATAAGGAERGSPRFSAAPGLQGNKLRPPDDDHHQATSTSRRADRASVLKTLQRQQQQLMMMMQQRQQPHPVQQQPTTSVPSQTQEHDLDQGSQAAAGVQHQHQQEPPPPAAADLWGQKPPPPPPSPRPPPPAAADLQALQGLSQQLLQLQANFSAAFKGPLPEGDPAPMPRHRHDSPSGHVRTATHQPGLLQQLQQRQQRQHQLQQQPQQQPQLQLPVQQQRDLPTQLQQQVQRQRLQESTRKPEGSVPCLQPDPHNYRAHAGQASANAGCAGVGCGLEVADVQGAAAVSTSDSRCTPEVGALWEPSFASSKTDVATADQCKMSHPAVTHRGLRAGSCSPDKATNKATDKAADKALTTACYNISIRCRRRSGYRQRGRALASSRSKASLGCWRPEGSGKSFAGGSSSNSSSSSRNRNCNSSSNSLLLAARQHAQQLQQQNDALVRVMERERQQQGRSRQQVIEVNLELQEVRTEYQVALQTLRQENVTLSAQVRKMLVIGGQQEVLDAYDAALSSLGATALEAQAAAAALAGQLCDTELQLQQLLVRTTKVNNIVLCSNTSSRSDERHGCAAAASAALSSHLVTGEGGLCAGCSYAAADASKGIKALRKHQKQLDHLVQQQQMEVAQLLRHNAKLLRYKKQFEVASKQLEQSAAARGAAEAAAEQAMLRATQAVARAEKLEQQVQQLQLEQGHLEEAKAVMHQQISDFQQQLQKMQQEARINGILYASPAEPLLGGLPGINAAARNGQKQAEAHDGLKTPAASQGSCAAAAAAAAAAVSNEALQSISQHVNDITNDCTFEMHPATSANTQTLGLQHSAAGLSSNPRAAAAGTSATVLSQHKRQEDQAQISQGQLPVSSEEHPRKARVKHSAVEWSESSAAAGSAAATRPQMAEPRGGPGGTAMSLAQQVSEMLPADSALQSQLSSLMEAIALGMQERKALAAQGQVLLSLVVGGSV